MRRISQPDRSSAVVLLAEDNPGEQALVERALRRSELHYVLRTVCNGEEALDYLYRRGQFADPADAPVPDLVLLDLNMPKVDGLLVLQTMKGDAALKTIPAVILTTSKAEEDVMRSYQRGCNSFLTKPFELAEFTRELQAVASYWLNLVTLPPKHG